MLQWCCFLSAGFDGVAGRVVGAEHRHGERCGDERERGRVEGMQSEHGPQARDADGGELKNDRDGDDPIEDAVGDRLGGDPPGRVHERQLSERFIEEYRGHGLGPGVAELGESEEQAEPERSLEDAGDEDEPQPSAGEQGCSGLAYAFGNACPWIRRTSPCTSAAAIPFAVIPKSAACALTAAMKAWRASGAYFQLEVFIGQSYLI